MIEFVGDEQSTWNVLPYKFEAGTPNVGDAVGLAAAVTYLDGMGMDRVAAHERELLTLAYESVASIDGARIYGPPPSTRSGSLTFTMAGIHPHDLATVLDEEGVCVRAGHHCAQPLVRRLDVPATARASFAVYNDSADVAALIVGLNKARALFGHAAG